MLSHKPKQWHPKANFWIDKLKELHLHSKANIYIEKAFGARNCSNDAITLTLQPKFASTMLLHQLCNPNLLRMLLHQLGDFQSRQKREDRATTILHAQSIIVLMRDTTPL